MKFLKNDVVLLLGFLLLFCFGLSFLRNDRQDVFFSIEHLEPNQEIELGSEVSNSQRKSTFVPAGTTPISDTTPVSISERKNERLTDLSSEQLLNYMRPLFMTKSASAITSFLKHIPVASVFRIVKAIVEDSKIHLPSRVKLRVIFAGAQRQKNRDDKFGFFDLVAQNKYLQKGVKPLVVKAVEAGYAHLVPDILVWARQVSIGDVAREALLYAARHDDEEPEALRELFEAGVSINPAVATELLYELVDSCSEGYSIAFLVRGMRASVDHIKDGITPLVKAVQNDKISVVVELLESGAKPEFKPSHAMAKNALQVAQEMDNVQIEAVIHRYSI